ncbi:DUF6691 family protein [Aquabacterium sp.]|uniref:DUF6691 family protein n=1 Tax=Aquabacterium sp. TaxID=1872578 RepID=UPI00344C2BF3
MARAASVAMALAVARRRTVSMLGEAMKLPAANQIDRRLIGGSLRFGVGWGIAGFCPGPGLVGMGLFEWLERRGRT